jgi:hypothetical protein
MGIIASDFTAWCIIIAHFAEFTGKLPAAEVSGGRLSDRQNNGSKP